MFPSPLKGRGDGQILIEYVTTAISLLKILLAKFPLTGHFNGIKEALYSKFC